MKNIRFSAARSNEWGGVVLALSLAVTFQVAASTSVGELRCEHLTDPLGIDTPKANLSWLMLSSQRAQRQTAYQILVASDLAKLRASQGDLWDSGRVASDETVQVPYGGKALTSRQQCYWKVRVWDREGKRLESPSARWEMGLLQPADWQAKWIARDTDTNATAAPLLRTVFSVDGSIRQARAYICGLGFHELYLNGQRVGGSFARPGLHAL